MSDIKEQIRIYSELAKAQKAVKDMFLKRRQQEHATGFEAKAAAERAAEPIVKPIVDAIEKVLPVKTGGPVDHEDLRTLIRQIYSANLAKLGRNELTKTVRHMYGNRSLFNVLLSLVRMGLLEFKTKKMYKFGLVDSLLFYGQSGSNLDMLPAKMERVEFKERLREFENFYEINAQSIEQVISEQSTIPAFEQLDDDEPDYSSTPDIPRRLLPSIPRRFYDTDYVSQFLTAENTDGGETTFADTTEGRGLVDPIVVMKERVAEIAAARNAGNTSLDIVNEAQDKLRWLLKTGNISKSAYKRINEEFK